MNAKLYVGNLSPYITEADLTKLFMQAGTVTSVALMLDRETHRSKGFAFIFMSNHAEAEMALEMFDGCNMDGLNLRVSIVGALKENFTSRPVKHSVLHPKRNFLRS